MNNKQSGTKKPHSSNAELDVDGDVAESVIITGDGNKVFIEKGNSSSNVLKKQRSRKSTSMLSNLFIGVLFGVIVILVGLLLGGEAVGSLLTGTGGLASQEEPIESPSTTPTYTAIPTEENAALEPVTEAPNATLTSTATPVPPVALGEDWMQGCVSTSWHAYPSTVGKAERGDGCWQEPISVFSAENGDLDFLAERGSGPEEVYGLFAPLPENGTVTFTIRLRDLSNADLLMGIYNKQDVTSQGLLMTLLNGDVSRRSFVQKDPKTYETVQGTVALDQNNGYSITFTFTTLSVISQVNPNVFFTNPISLPSQKWLFLGYKGLRGYYRIEGTFLNFELN